MRKIFFCSSFPKYVILLDVLFKNNRLVGTFETSNSRFYSFFILPSDVNYIRYNNMCIRFSVFDRFLV